MAAVGGAAGAPAPGEQTFVGCIMSFNQDAGYGFLSCSESHARYGRDVFVHKSDLGSFRIGDSVAFQVLVDAKTGVPMAKGLRPAPAPAAAGPTPGSPRAALPPPPPAKAPPSGTTAVAVRAPVSAAPAGAPGGDVKLQQMLLEQQQEKEQLMQLQMMVTQVLVQSAMAKQQAAEQEKAMQQQFAMMQQSADAAQSQQQFMEEQMQQQMQMQQMQMQQQMMMAQSMMGPCGMGFAPGTMTPMMTAAAMGTMPQMMSPPNIDTEKRYVGVIKSFNTAKGIGFVECPDIMEKFGCEVFLHASQVQNDEAVGDMISFTVQLGRLGQPRAKDIKTIGSVQDPEGGENKEPKQVYTGQVKHFNAEKGFGFVACAETQAQFGCDVFLHKDQFVGMNVGDTVRFTLRLSLKGQPQAKDVQRVDGGLPSLPALPAPGGEAACKASLPPPPPASRSAPYAKASNVPPPPPVFGGGCGGGCGSMPFGGMPMGGPAPMGMARQQFQGGYGPGMAMPPPGMGLGQPKAAPGLAGRMLPGNVVMPPPRPC